MSSFDIIFSPLACQRYVVLDWEGLDRLSPPVLGYRNCITVAINVGIDMVVNSFSLSWMIENKKFIESMLLQVVVPFKYEVFIHDLINLVESGEVPIGHSSH